MPVFPYMTCQLRIVWIRKR